MMRYALMGVLGLSLASCAPNRVSLAQVREYEGFVNTADVLGTDTPEMHDKLTAMWAAYMNAP